ncbi:MAG: TSCPD domain-containing protein [Deltaproteobacteria bacterium]|nr:TSCPD domain-containing protein [Deltaproteobacteria bacterium]
MFKTQGVCPPEIHFRLEEGRLTDIRFVGGGCPGNARLVSRLLLGREVAEILPLLDGIDCRNDTSCPDQLGRALSQALSGDLAPAASFRRLADPAPHQRVALLGHLAGRLDLLEEIWPAVEAAGVEAVYTLGDLSGPGGAAGPLRKFLAGRGVVCLCGEQDWALAQGRGAGQPLPAREADALLQLPQAVSFLLGERIALGFPGGYLAEMPDFSDFEPFALEINMVSGLADYLQDPSVFPALEAMLPQFTAGVVAFAQTGAWGRWDLGGATFLAVGALDSPGGPAWGLLESRDHETIWQIMGPRGPLEG